MISQNDMNGRHDRDAFIKKVKSLPWFHQIDLGNGIISPGNARIEDLQAQADAMLGQISLIGKSVLDIGCYDGFYSFDAYKRGAGRVLATDHFMWQRDPRCREAFEIARECVAPRLEAMDIDLQDLAPEVVGYFDVVLFSGVLYHMRHPFLAVERVAKLATNVLVVETHLDAREIKRPAMIFYPTTELNNDPTNWWGPNRACVEAMLHDVGFKTVTYQPNPAHPLSRGIFHARR